MWVNVGENAFFDTGLPEYRVGQKYKNGELIKQT